jgi:hypothetical protein
MSTNVKREMKRIIVYLKKVIKTIIYKTHHFLKNAAFTSYLEMIFVNIYRRFNLKRQCAAKDSLKL